ncbi:hypothetical protein GCM10010187_48470 [Actinomadura coerulea]|nr:hypothetical protein GCM10010187_48470 [Actinomadura coerulea]
MQAPRTLILGRYEHRRRRLRVVARSTRCPLRRGASWPGLLAPAGDEHPWPQPLPAGWAGGLTGAQEPIWYTRVLPELAAETAVDAAVEHGRWRHAVQYLRLRSDLAARDVPQGLDIE